ncbi:hypothetical protein NDU88_003378 [Pleurodeles waltl]|uniref:Uncharacterized protein n=1 Tax=Pleurodeles waltl TaxID=8319 RepID=A0AAV7LLF9_PLEWA|nr:hypothetical protein NDU88_003378 [Pleurodeles waltl]
MAAPRSKDRGGHSGFPAGLAGDRQKAARQPSRKPLPTRKPAPNGAGGVGRGPTTPHTTILFLAGEPPGTGWRYGVSKSPWWRSKLRRHGGFLRAAENRRETAGFPVLTAAKPLRSECPAEHRQPVGGAPADPGTRRSLSAGVGMTTLVCGHPSISQGAPTSFRANSPDFVSAGTPLHEETTEAIVVSESAIDVATLVGCPLNMDKYKQLPLINGVEVQAYMDTGASVTMVIEKLVHPEQHSSTK